jgi:4-amino-4-deoxy-L-arabinose transferase-like glycosyltransferase
VIQLTQDEKPAVNAGLFSTLRRARYVVPAAFALFLLISIPYALTKKPWLDEALNGSAAYSLVAHGQFGIPQLEESGMTITNHLPQIQHYCYIFGPNYLFAAAAWMKVFGYGLMQIRSFSMAWALLAMFAWFVVIERLTRDKVAAALGIFLLAVNYQFIVEAADGRFDMMCASLGSAGLALFLAWREKNLSRAIVAGSFAAAAAFFTHPMGALYGMALVWTILCVDFRRIRLVHAVMFVVPWLLFAGGASLWISPHRAIAEAQFAAATKARWIGLAHPVRSLVTDISQRYLFFFWSGEQSALNHLKGLILLVHVLFIIGGLCIRQVRSTLAYRTLAPCVLILYCGIALLDAFKWPYYMVHIFVFASAVVAVTAARLRFTAFRLPAAAAVAVLALVEVGGIGAKIRLNQYGNEFIPTIEYIRSHSSPTDYVEGEMPLNFGLGYSNPRFHMDNRMGYYTGVRPALIVTGQFADLDYIRAHEPNVYQFIRHRLDVEYRQVAQYGDYKIYAVR